MKNTLYVRFAERSELKWINECYDKVDFVQSKFDNEIIAIAEFDGEKAGVGRLVKIDDQTFELGGIYVSESFRNKGIAKKLVIFLLDYVMPSKTVYCIPFEHLAPFYKKCGFTDCYNLDLVPKEVVKKYFWCKEKYSQPTSLLVLKK